MGVACRELALHFTHNIISGFSPNTSKFVLYSAAAGCSGGIRMAASLTMFGRCRQTDSFG